MVRDAKILREFEKSTVRRSRPNYRRNVRIAWALLRQARRMGKFPPRNKLEGIEIDIRYAKAINGVR
ncbi:MAG: hypothetical protein AUI33_16215 [Ignavibacteria bacterium 13_1_40CM_2_61_4]|nr:MAG: hypothetical protein AUI33_16215 [Ignavibacteria bacterium 13_1_40CM_2_61_4]